MQTRKLENHPLLGKPETGSTDRSSFLNEGQCQVNRRSIQRCLLVHVITERKTTGRTDVIGTSHWQRRDWQQTCEPPGTSLVLSAEHISITTSLASSCGAGNAKRVWRASHVSTRTDQQHAITPHRTHRKERRCTEQVAWNMEKR